MWLPFLITCFEAPGTPPGTSLLLFYISSGSPTSLQVSCSTLFHNSHTLFPLLGMLILPHRDDATWLPGLHASVTFSWGPSLMPWTGRHNAAL